MERTVLVAPEGKRYKKGDVYGIEIFLGFDENPSDWELVDESEIQEDAEDESI
jgi:hypothetical protein